MDIERTMQFILDQQAQFSSDIARINSVLLGAAERQRKFEQNYPGVGKKPCSAQQPLRNGRMKILATLATRHISIEELTTNLTEGQSASEDVTASLMDRKIAIEDLTASLTDRQIAIEDLTARLTERQIALGEFTKSLAESKSKVEQEMADLRKTRPSRTPRNAQTERWKY